MSLHQRGPALPSGAALARTAPPIFVVLEGLDGSGKSSVARVVAAGLGAELLSTPPEFLRDVRDRIDSGYAASPRARALFYASTVAFVSDRARANLAAGRSTVVDRYWLTTLAYAAAEGAPLDASVLEAGLLVPDATWFLDVPRHVRMQRMSGRGVITAGDRDSLRPPLELRLLGAYEAHARRWCPGAFVRVDASCQTPDELSVVLLDSITRRRA